MPSPNLQAQEPENNLLDAVEQLSSVELEAFVQQVLALRAKRLAPSLSSRETELLLAINQTLPEADQSQYAVLVEKRQDETLTEEEQEELVELSDRIELLHAERMAALVTLSQLRQTSLVKLMEEFGIPDHKSDRLNDDSDCMARLRSSESNLI